MSSSAVQGLYAQVIGDVITNVRQHFLDEGIDEEVLMELQTIWERNLATQRAIDSAPNEEDQQAEATTHHELLIEAPALDPVPAAGNMAKTMGADTFNSSMAQAQYQHFYNMQSSAGQAVRAMARTPGGVMAGHAPVHMQQPQIGFGYNQQPMQPQQQQSQQPQQQQPQQQQQQQQQQFQQQQQYQQQYSNNLQGMAANYMRQQQAQYNQAGGLAGQQQPMIQYQYMPPNYNAQGFNTQNQNNPNVPQTDGAADEPIRTERPVVEFEGLRRISKREALRLRRKYRGQVHGAQSSSRPKAILQLDGPHDDEDEEADPEVEAGESEDDVDEEELGSDLDDPVEDDDLETDHLVLCQFDKVNHVKTKWKCVLKDGVVHINNGDYVFKKATGEFDWIQS